MLTRAARLQLILGHGKFTGSGIKEQNNVPIQPVGLGVGISTDRKTAWDESGECSHALNLNVGKALSGWGFGWYVGIISPEYPKNPPVPRKLIGT